MRETQVEDPATETSQTAPSPASTLADEIVAAILDVRQNGGGSVWLHRQFCTDPEQDDGCSCDPYEILVLGYDA